MGDSLRQHDLHQVRRVSPVSGDLSGLPRPCQNSLKMERDPPGVKSGGGGGREWGGVMEGWKDGVVEWWSDGAVE
jgi:hypothetical protein